MIVALDYDGTYTVDPDTFDQVVHLFNRSGSGNKVMFVTYRSRDRAQGNADIEEDAERLGLDIIYTNGLQKKDMIEADIWIDDKPELIPTLTSLHAELGYVKPRRRAHRARHAF